MEIAKGIQAEKYLELDLTDYKSKNWDTAIEYMRLRLTERFIEPADKLIEFEENLSAYQKKYGFAVLAIDCMLSETIQSFYEGVTDSSGRSRQIFTRFLRERENFKPYFSTDVEADHFYINFRCGILHQTQTSKDTRVWAVGDFIKRDGRFITVNRELYHSKIKDELAKYIEILKAKDDIRLLKKFSDKNGLYIGPLKKLFCSTLPMSSI